MAPKPTKEAAAKQKQAKKDRTNPVATPGTTVIPDGSLFPTAFTGHHGPPSTRPIVVKPGRPDGSPLTSESPRFELEQPVAPVLAKPPNAGSKRPARGEAKRTKEPRTR